MASASVIAGKMVVSRRASFMVKIQSYRDRHNFTFFSLDGPSASPSIAWGCCGRHYLPHSHELRWNASAVIRAMQCGRGVGAVEAWQATCEDAAERYASGRFLLERLGAERFLDPQLMATLWALRQGLMEEYGTESPAMTMVIDLAVMAYFNALRVQGWIGDLSLVSEQERSRCANTTARNSTASPSRSTCDVSGNNSSPSSSG